MYSIEWLTRKRAEVQAKARASGTGRYSVYHNPDHPRASPVGERFDRDGAVMITPQQHALLRAIRAREDRAFPSIRAWVDAAAQLETWLHRSGLLRCVRRLPEVWVARIPQGRRRLCTLQARGLAIVDGEIPVRLLGTGRIDRAAQAAPGGRGTPGAEVRGPGIGELLDRIQELGATLDDAHPDDREALRARFIDLEVLLSARRKRLEGPIDPSWDYHGVSCCQVGAERRSLLLFLWGAADAGLSSIAVRARQALSFPFFWHQVLALEEVVLGGEARALGFTVATGRRQELRERVLEELARRVVEIAPTDGSLPED